MLGTCDHEIWFNTLLKRLQNPQLHLPVVVGLECRYCENFYRICIFPAFYSIDRHPTILQVLAESFHKEHSSSSYTLVNIHELLIYLVDSCNVPSIHPLTKDMTMTLPSITSLTFRFKNPCEIVSFLLTMIARELRSIPVILATTRDEEIYLYVPRPA